MLSGFERFSRLYRDPGRSVLAGVCAGVADFIGLTPVQVRLLTLLGLVFFFVPTVLAYVALAIVLPVKPSGLYPGEEEAAFWQGVRMAPEKTLQSLAARFAGCEVRLADMESFVASEEYELRRKFRDIEG
jgi:phage shock protein C